MASSTGPDLVTDGLVLVLDVGNEKSYPGTGTTWTDLSSNGLNASGASVISNGYLLDTQPYNTASTSILDTDYHSIFMMLQINGTNGSWSKIFGYTPSGTDRSPGIWRHPNSRRLHWRYDPSNTGFDFGPTSVSSEFNANTWYYVGATKNGNILRGYSNGIEAHWTSLAANPKTSGSSTIQLYPSYNQGTSKMAFIQIYNRVLTAEEIAQNFNATRGRFGI